jgi:outer membrane protein assembly factor BamE (lipoprotein component of BamABCDE complex)
MMSKYSFLVVALISISIALSACRSSKKITNTDTSELKTSVEDLKKENRISSIPLANFDFNYLQAKAKVAASSKGKNYNLTFNIRMQKNEIIWISVNAIGSIEVARVLMNKDSVRIIDRINNQYLVKDYDFLSEMLNVPLDFISIQNLILGNAAAIEQINKWNYKESEESYQLSRAFDDLEYFYTFRNADNKLAVFTLQENSSEPKSVRVEYGDFRAIEGASLPFLINTLASSQKESLKLDVQYTKVEKQNTLDFPFNVPKRFE